MGVVMITRRQVLGGLVCMPVLWLSGCQSSPTGQKLPKGSKVVALGDSLTVGVGVDKADSYPRLLAQKTGWIVENMGISGDTTAQVLARLPSAIKQRPKLVLLGIGGNDVLRRVPAKISQGNLLTIVHALMSEKIDVVLIAQPYLSVSALFGKASDNPMYQEVAKQTNVPLLQKAWSQILSDNSLKSDQIHANKAGYARFTQILYDFLQELGYA